MPNDFSYSAETDPEAFGGPDAADDPAADDRPYDPAGWYEGWIGPDDPAALADAEALADDFARTFGADPEGMPLGVYR